MFEIENIRNKNSQAILKNFNYAKGLLQYLQVDPTKGLNPDDQNDIQHRISKFGNNSPIPLKTTSFCSMVFLLLAIFSI